MVYAWYLYVRYYRVKLKLSRAKTIGQQPMDKLIKERRRTTMLMQFVGISEMSFDTKEGNHIEGTNLYLLTQNPNVEGLEALKLFVPRSIALPKGMELNKKVDVEFNHKGKLVKISLA